MISTVATTVLVVDDDPGFRRLAVRLLERAGFCATREADTAKQAREVVHQARPAFVLLDVSLPDGSGVTLAGELDAAAVAAAGGPDLVRSRGCQQR